MRPRPEALALGERWKLGFDRTPPRGPAGERLARGTGASLEFHDRRSYVAGDDVRHLDWRAYARTDQLLVRQWREEVLARCEILLDVSRSMEIEPRKAQLAVDLAGLFSRAAAESGALAVVLPLDSQPRQVSVAEFEREGVTFEGRASLGDALRGVGGLCRRGAMTLVISDFLSPHDAAELVRPLAARAGALGMIQVLAQEDMEPPLGRAARMTDCESDETLDIVLDATTVARYVERLERLQGALEENALRAGARFSRLIASSALEDQCRAYLAPQGFLVPAH
jgi:uncharacterized protein (DUF58 family)